MLVTHCYSALEHRWPRTQSDALPFLLQKHMQRMTSLKLAERLEKRFTD